MTQNSSLIILFFFQKEKLGKNEKQKVDKITTPVFVMIIALEISTPTVTYLTFDSP